MSSPTTVSLFCGAGGESAGKELAFRDLGIDTTSWASHAINHWDLAVATHAANFPRIHVHQEDITKVTAATYGIGHIDLLWASPSCVHHSRARGGKPCEDQQRSHADEVVDRWLRVAQVDVLLVENVPEFAEWGPLYPDHGPTCPNPDHSKIGKPFKCHFGQPIPERKGEFFRRFLAKLTALGYRAEHRILCAADFGDPTTRRRFFLQAVRSGPIVWPEPTHRDPRKGADMFTGHLPTWRTAAECIDWSIPCPSIFTRTKPLAEATLRRIAAGVVRYVLQGKPFIVGVGGRAGQSPNRPVDEPMRAGTTKADSALCAASMISMRGTSPEQILATAGSVEAPLPTVSSGGIHAALCSAFLSSYYGAKSEGDARGAAMESPLPTQPTVNRHALVAATMIQSGYGERDGQAPRTLDIEQPLGTVVAGGIKHGLVAAHMMSIDQQSTGASACRSAEDPLSTATTKARHALVAATLMTNTTGHAPTDLEQPLPTVTTGNHQALVAAFISHYYGQGTTAQDPGQPLHTITTLARHGLITVEIDGETFVLTDIGMRMLEPRELARAMGFPESFRFVDAADKPLTKRDQVKQIGNACPVHTVCELIKAVVLQRPAAFGAPKEWTA